MRRLICPSYNAPKHDYTHAQSGSMCEKSRMLDILLGYYQSHPPITSTPHSIHDTAVNGRYPVDYPPRAKVGGLTLTDLVAHLGSPWLALFRPTNDHMANVGLKYTWDH